MNERSESLLRVARNIQWTWLPWLCFAEGWPPGEVSGRKGKQHFGTAGWQKGIDQGQNLENTAGDEQVPMPGCQQMPLLSSGHEVLFLGHPRWAALVLKEMQTARPGLGAHPGKGPVCSLLIRQLADKQAWAARAKPGTASRK